MKKDSEQNKYKAEDASWEDMSSWPGQDAGRPSATAPCPGAEHNAFVRPRPTLNHPSTHNHPSTRPFSAFFPQRSAAAPVSILLSSRVSPRPPRAYHRAMALVRLALTSGLDQPIFCTAGQKYRVSSIIADSSGRHHSPLPNPGDRHVGVRGAVDRRLRCGHGCAVRPQQDSQVAAGAHPPRCLRGLTRLQRRQPCSNPGKENRQDSSSACDVEGPVP